MLEELVRARDEKERSTENDSKESDSKQPPRAPVPPSPAPASSEFSSIRFLKPRSKTEPPTSENLEEYRRKLSFLANLLNSPRWTLPESDAVLTKMVRNQRVPFEQQAAELGVLSTVQKHVQTALRAQLQLPNGPEPQSDLSRSSSVHLDGELPLEDRTESTSPTKKLLSSRASASSRRAASPASPNGRSEIDNVFMEPGFDIYRVQDDFGRFQGDEEGAEAEGLSNHYNDDEGSESFARYGSETNERPVARQLWHSGDSLPSASGATASSYSSEFGRKQGKGDEDDQSDLSRLLSADIRLQDELTDDLVKYASAMKESAMHAGRKIRDDSKKLDQMSEKMVANTDTTKAATGTVNELLNATSTSIWSTLSMLSMVIIAFICVYIFMKIVPKPRY